MYRGHSIWDEEQEKQERYANIVTDEEGGKEGHHHEGDYASRDEQSDVYNKGKAESGKNKEKEAEGIEKDVMEQEKKYEKKGEASDEEIKRKAASEVHEGTKKEEGKDNKDKKAHKSIEDAINKAMKEEKEVIYVDD